MEDYMKTKKPIFEAGDFGELLSYPTGSWVDKLSEEVMKVLYVDIEAVKKD